MKKLNQYITEKLKINKDTESDELIDRIIKLCAIDKSDKEVIGRIETWISFNKIDNVDILCWHETLDNFRLEHNKSKYIIDDVNLYTNIITDWHDTGATYSYKSDKKDSFSIGYNPYTKHNYAGYLVLTQDDNGFKTFILLDHKNLKKWQ